MPTEFNDGQHFGVFTTSPSLTSNTGKMVRQSELTLAAMRAAGILDNMTDGVTPPNRADYAFWLDKNFDPAILKAWSAEALAWMPVTYDSFFRLAAESSLNTYKELIAGFASDVISQGNVPIYATAAGMPGITVPPGINAVRVNGRAIRGDGFDGLFVDYDNGSLDKFVSADGRTWFRAVEPVTDRANAAYEIADEASQSSNALANFISNTRFCGCFAALDGSTANILLPGQIIPIPFVADTIDTHNWWAPDNPTAFYTPNLPGLIGVRFRASLQTSNDTAPATGNDAELRVATNTGNGWGAYPGFVPHNRRDGGREFVLASGVIPAIPNQVFRMEFYHTGANPLAAMATFTSFSIEAVFNPE